MPNNMPVSDRMRSQIERGLYMQKLMKKAPMNRHQIAKIAGLADSHVKGLEDGVVEKPNRSSLVHLGLAINLSLNEIDDLLGFFYAPKLTREDKHLFFEMAKKRGNTKLTKTLQPLYGQNISLDLLLLSMDSIDGDLIVFNDKLPLALRPKGFSSSLYGLDNNQIYSYIIEQLQKERVKLLIENLNNYKLIYFTTKPLLKNFIKTYSIDKYKHFLIDHVLNFIDCLDNYNNFDFKIVVAGPLFRFAIKTPKSNDISKKLFFVGHALYGGDNISEYRKDWLRGYATDDDNLVNHFYQEYEKLLPLVDNNELSDNTRMKEFVLKLLFEEDNIDKKFLEIKISEREKDLSKKFPHNILE